MSRILVVGGAGFIGSQVVSHALSDSQHSVTVVDSLASTGGTNRVRAFDKSDRLRFVRADAADSALMSDLLASDGYDVVLQLATGWTVGLSGPDPMTE